MNLKRWSFLSCWQAQRLRKSLASRYAARRQEYGRKNKRKRGREIFSIHLNSAATLKVGVYQSANHTAYMLVKRKDRA